MNYNIALTAQVIQGDLLDQPVEAIINADAQFWAVWREILRSVILAGG